MAEIDLKAYTARAVELETAIYTQKILMKEHEQIIQTQQPVAPVMTKPEEPVEPQLPKLSSEKLDIGFSIFLTIGGLLLMLLGAWGTIIGIIVFLIGIGSIFGSYTIRRSNIAWNTKKSAEYKEQLELYQRRKEAYPDDLAIFEQSHAAANAQFQAKMLAYTADSTKAKQQHADALSSLENALNALYDQNIVYPKYRNMIAMTTINEYLMSGRCSELEGASGAYNLYEMELRQNIIINQLSNIVSNLEQIRNNQFALYQELARAHATVDNILHEIKQVNENTKLTAYFAGVTALIEASPKVTYGRIYSY